MSDRQPLTGPNALLLIASCALTTAPFFFYQPASFTALALLLFGWRAYLSHSRLIAPPKGLLVLIGLTGVALALFEFRTLFGREPGLALLSLLLPLKLLEARSTRDARVATSLCCFLLTGQFLQAQTLSMAAVVLACALCILATTAGIQAPGRGLRQNFLGAAKLLLAGLPIMLAFFVLFPRLDSPLWRLPLDTKTARAGLSDSMSPGSISALIESGEIAFRVDFQGPVPPVSQRYWRAVVFTEFDGQTWRAGPLQSAFPPAPETKDRPYAYTLTLEPHDQAWMPALDYLVGDPADGRYLDDFSLRAATPVTARKRYSLSADPDLPVGLDEDPARLRASLSLPARSNPRTQALGQSIAQRAKDPAERVRQAILEMRNSDLVYTLYPPLLGRHGSDEFLFETKRGFCEHFSNAFVVLMRAAGVPARVVTGYLGGEINPVDGSLVVRQSDAHAWAEVWLKGQGWVRVDPTSTSAPRRIAEGIASALPEGEALPMSLSDYAWLKAMRHRWEALNHGWNQWVLGYDARKQLELLRELGFAEADWKQLVALLAASAAIWMAWLSLRALPRRPRPDPLDSAWRKFCARLAKAGISRSPWESPSAFAQRAAASLPSRAEEIRQIAEEYAILRYGPLPLTREALAGFRRRVSTFKPQQSR